MAARHRRPKKPRPGAIPAQHYRFIGTLVSATPPAGPNLAALYARYGFTVLADEGAATITGGWAKWAVVDRPQRVGMTVLQGYDPVTMDVPVLFDNVVQQDGADLERDIQVLEWMAGRGKLFASDGHVGASGQGDSPIVSVFSAASDGVETPMIPPNVHDLDWVVTGISYDANPLRARNGHRIRQAAAVTLTQHVGSPGTSLDSAAVRARARKAATGRYKVIVTTTGVDTYQQIAAKYAPKPTFKSAVAIMNANKDNGNRHARQRSVNKHMGAHVRVRVPLAIYEGLA
jgi:hypothetical protein